MHDGACQNSHAISNAIRCLERTVATRKELQPDEFVRMRNGRDERLKQIDMNPSKEHPLLSKALLDPDTLRRGQL